MFYRSRTWEHQRKMGEPLLPSYYPEKRKNACDYKRWTARKWKRRSINKRENLTWALSNPYLYARMVVYSIFPENTQAGALSVVACETGHTYDESATNSSSGTMGYFQVHPGNVGRVLYWGSRRMVIQHNSSNSLYDPWYNTKVAHFLSKGGTNWSEWHCQPFRGIG